MSNTLPAHLAKKFRTLRRKEEDEMNGNITEEIDQWIEMYGNARDALNVSLAKLRHAQEELADKELVKAEQQLTGFVHGYQGYNIIDLVDAMGLSSDEWQTLKKNMEWLPISLKAQINSHFSDKP